MFKHFIALSEENVDCSEGTAEAINIPVPATVLNSTGNCLKNLIMFK